VLLFRRIPLDISWASPFVDTLMLLEVGIILYWSIDTEICISYLGVARFYVASILIQRQYVLVDLFDCRVFQYWALATHRLFFMDA
jgi:hypothetical protein